MITMLTCDSIAKLWKGHTGAMSKKFRSSQNGPKFAKCELTTCQQFPGQVSVIWVPGYPPDAENGQHDIEIRA